MNKDTQLIWERFLYTEKDSIGRERKPQRDAKFDDGETPLDVAIKHKNTETAELLRKHGGKTGAELKADKLEGAASLIERIYVYYKPHEGQKENILDYFNGFDKPGSQDKIREILQKKMVSILRDDPQSDHAKMMMDIMVIIGQPKEGGNLPPVF
jgi:hypothetical protein